MTDTLTISRQDPLWTTGRRKTAVARVRVVPGNGRMVVNGKSLDEFFGGNHRQKSSSISPLRLSELLNKFDLFVTVEGGGVTGQAEAIRLGISRALLAMDDKMRLPLRAKGFLTRDPRMVERKKPGRPKARKRYQFSKR